MIRSIRYITLLVLLQFVTGISVLYAQSITSASGIVRDSVSGEPLSYVSVMFENSTIGAMTDDDGAFSLQNDKGLTRLVVSSLGYDNKVVNLKAGQKNNALNVLLRPTSFEIAEVVVKPKREKYSRKDNPAVELIKKVIEHKNDNRIEAKDEFAAYGKDVAMQVAAANPSYVDEAAVPAEVVAKEKEILLAQMANDPKMANKPDQVKEKIVMGKLNKFYAENCLLQQAFVKDGDVSVEQYMNNAAKALGGKVSFNTAVRFEKGEGIEKKQENFAAEIASMVNGNK